MKNFKVTTLFASVILASGSHVAFAKEQAPSNQELQAMIEKVVNQRTANLQQQVATLQHQVGVLKHALYQQKQVSSSSAADRTPKGNQNTDALAAEPAHPRFKAISAREVRRMQAENNVLTGIYLGGTPVFTSPYLGVHSAYDGSDLVVNASSVNLDTRLLTQFKALKTELARRGLPFPDHPVIDLSGKLEAQGIFSKTSPGTSNGDIDLSSATLDFIAEMNPWIMGFASLAYDNAATSPYRIGNSNISLDKGFVTIGNLNKSPFYTSIGQLYVPFGQYSSYFVSSPVTQLLGRTKARALVAGFYPMQNEGIYGAAYVFRSDVKANKSAAGGVNLGVKGSAGDLHSNLAVGLISTVADSQGMQSNGAPASVPFSGFGMSNAAEQLAHSVPGVDINGSLDYKDYSLLGEYVASTQAFNSQDLSFNGHGAKPKAFHVEGIYHFTLADKPGNIGLSFGWTDDALALLLPRERYMAVINYSFFRDTVASLEFRHDKNYGLNDRASGASLPQFAPQYKYANMLTAQFGIYF